MGVVTFGWILAAWPFTFILVDWDKDSAPLTLSGIAGWYGSEPHCKTGSPVRHCRTQLSGPSSSRASPRCCSPRSVSSFPHTPPKKAGSGGAEKLAWAEAVKLLKHPFVTNPLAGDLCRCFRTNNCYFNWTGSFLGTDTSAGGVAGSPGNWIMPVMSVGQVAELLTMFILGATALKRLGWRATMIVGIPRSRRAFRRLFVFPATQRPHHHRPDSSWRLLRVLLRHGLYFRGCLFSQGCPRQRPGFVQRDDSGRRRARRQHDLSGPAAKRLHPQ